MEFYQPSHLTLSIQVISTYSKMLSYCFKTVISQHATRASSTLAHGGCGKCSLLEYSASIHYCKMQMFLHFSLTHKRSLRSNWFHRLNWKRRKRIYTLCTACNNEHQNISRWSSRWWNENNTVQVLKGKHFPKQKLHIILWCFTELLKLK